MPVLLCPHPRISQALHRKTQAPLLWRAPVPVEPIHPVAPSLRSPVKSKPRLDPETINNRYSLLNMEVSNPQDTESTNMPYTDPIAQFATTGQPRSDITLKEKLMSLRSSIRYDLMFATMQSKTSGPGRWSSPSGDDVQCHIIL